MSGSNPDITPIVGFKRGLVTGDLSTKSMERSFKNSCLKRTAAPYFTPGFYKLLRLHLFSSGQPERESLLSPLLDIEVNNKFHSRSLNVN